ncbi:hypothetical protein V2J09_007994 [Rumex salicifolius]
MDELPSRKSSAALSYSRKASSGLVVRNSAEKGDRTTQVCSRVGCGSKINSSKGHQIGCSGKAKTTRHPFGLSNSGKEVVGSSSKTSLAQSGPRKPNSDPRKKLPFRQVADLEIRSLSQNLEASDSVNSPNNSQVRLTKLVQNNVSGEASSSSSTPHSTDGKRTMRKPELGKCDSSIGSSTSLASKQGNYGARNGASTSKYNLKNLKCNSINDVVSSGCSASLPSASSSDLSLDRNRVMSRKRIGEAEGSLHTRGKKIIDPVLEDRRNDTSNRGISITSSRRTRNFTSTRDNDNKPVGMRRSGFRAGLNEQDDRYRSRQMESSSTPRRLSTSRSNNNSNGSLAAFDSGFDSSFLNTENVGHYMLLALDGIEQDEQPSYEQMLAMEANFLLSGLVFHDQHRDMRLDIDSMSYEELLALGESIGTVSTALTEEALEKCLKKSIYQATTTDEGTLIGEADDIKCCICQEEYEEGSKVGRLECEHQYHVECIQKWLQLKNWCPICKANAGPSSSPRNIS